MKDARGLPFTTTHPSALEAYERALLALRTYRGDPLAPLDEALALDPGFAGAHAAKALVLMTFFERRFARDARAALEAGAQAIARGNERERALAHAARLLAEGEWHAAVAALDRVLVDHPHDILAIQVAHLIDFFRCDSLNLRNRITRVLPCWPKSLPGRSFVLGMQAFGLEECNQYPEAEAAARAALEESPEDCWSTHALTHVFEMQGRIDEGAAFLEQTTGDWATPDNGFAFHNWWHLALFHMDRARFDRALAIYDDVLAGAHAMALSRLDATALLWRLHLEEADVGRRFEAVADSWAQDLEAEGGFYAFNDFHAALAFAATGRRAQAARLREILADSATGPGANAEMARAVGIGAADAVIAFSEGRFAEAAEGLAAIRDGASRFGGSHAQRDVLTLTLVEAARRAGRPALARHYLNERLVQKPGGAWGMRIAKRVTAGAREPVAAA